MKAAELRDLGADELGAKERELTDQLFRLRIQKSMGQLEAPTRCARSAAIWRGQDVLAEEAVGGRQDGVNPPSDPVPTRTMSKV
jgi:ribosomal protein L29